MPRQDIERVVDGLIARGRIQAGMRDQYINMMAASPELEAEFSGLLLRGDDYTNKTKELAEQRRQAAAEIEAQRRAVQVERQRLQDWERTSQGEISEANRIRDEHLRLAAKAAAMEQTLRDYNMLDYVSLPPDSGTRTPAPVQPAPTPSNPTNPAFITKDEAGRALAEVMALNGKVMRIAAQHQELFGTPLNEDLLSHHLATGEDVEQYWQVKYGVPTKKAELQARQAEADRVRIREEERAKLMAEMSLDPSRITGAPSFNNQGMNPVMAKYANQKAVEHAADPGQGDFVVPEKKPEIAASRARIAAATDFFNKHFDVNGNPLNEAGRQMREKYFNPES